MPHLLIIDAPYYEHINNALLEGAEAVLKEAGATWERVSVPGVLEIPAALSMATMYLELDELEELAFGGLDDDDEADSHERPDRRRFDGFILLGCVIRGETTHYDIVAFESARAIVNLTVNRRLALGNGIQTVENEEQALERARPDRLDKGGGAARAALMMIDLAKQFDV